MGNGFFNSKLIKGIENGELPEMEVNVRLDLETVAVAIAVLLIAFVLGIVVFKQVFKGKLAKNL
ncbi:hypothetical protein JKY72_01580 [Candidatus Gracilibacteria bacterium]|nr:hypothetical protein [Candidatus Gracilibacteria bacterium]